VKNTFLDDLLEDSSPESAPGVIERSTCPVFSARKEASSFEAPPPELLQPIRAPWPSEMTTMDSFTAPGCDRMSWSSIASGYEPDMPIKVISRDVPATQQPKAKNLAGMLPAPSMGSQRHGRGGPCTPCPFFWKPSGCIEGRACNFCHLCPDQPVTKALPKQVTVTKGAATATLAQMIEASDSYAQYVGSQSAAGSSTTSEEHHKVLEMQQKLCPGIFEDHAAGHCKPCTFFWKPEGCRKSEACHHCHLCPPSALKDRKLQKVLARRQEKAGSSGKPSGKEVQSETCAPSTVPMPAGLVYL